VPQGIGADLIATIGGWNREDVDAFAAESHHRAAKAWANGYFADSVVPVVDINGVTVLDADELIRPDTSVEGLAGLKPTPASTTSPSRSTTGWRRSTTSTTPATPRASSTERR
jgi:acetyl-CoA acetyltransferase